MIFCKSKKFIFLRVPKTASTSISSQIVEHTDFQRGDFYTSFDFRPSWGFRHINGKSLVSFYKHQHANLDDLFRHEIANLDDIKDFQIYGVLRNPVDRFFSVFKHFLSNFRNDIADMSLDQIADSAFDTLKKTKLPYHYYVEEDNRFFPLLPQSHWLLFRNQTINRIVLYPHFSEMLQTLTGTAELEYDKKIGIQTRSKSVSPATIQEIRKWYPEDFRLWDQFS